MQSDHLSPVTDILSVAIDIENEKHLRKLNQNEPLSKILHDICTEFSLSKDSEMYALQFMEQDVGDNKYVTEENRSDIKNGSILRLDFSASEIVKQINAVLDKNNTEIEKKQWAFSKLSTLSVDPVFAKEFLASRGYRIMMSAILNLTEIPVHLTHYLQSLICFMNHHLIPPLEENMITQFINFINSNQPMDLIECCLVILKKVVQQKNHFVISCLNILELIPLLWNRHTPAVQEKALSLINALVQSDNTAKMMDDVIADQIRNTIQKNILCFKVSKGMAHELYVYQTLKLGLLENKLLSRIDPSGADAKYIEEMNNILASADKDMRNVKGSIASLYEDDHYLALLNRDLSDSKFGKPFYNQDFVCSTPQLAKSDKVPSYKRSKSVPLPVRDLSKSNVRHSLLLDFSSISNSSVTICRLTLECMLHFARCYRGTFVQIVLEEEEAYLQSFPSTCECLVRLLCEFLGVGKLPSSNGMLYQPLVFTAPHNHPFVEEMFCRLALLMGRTRREMRARTLDDQEKVVHVVQRQLKEALALKPVTYEQLHHNLRKFPYSVIAEMWQKEHEEKENWELTHLSSVIKLKEENTNAILQLIHQHRINTLMRGAKFPKYTDRAQRVKKKSWFVYLSSNEKTFHYGDCDDMEKPIVECTNQILISNIRTLVTGKKCPHTKDMRNRKTDQEITDLAFSILLDEDHLDFVAPNQLVFDHWTDGISCLLDQPMTSKTKENDLKKLLELEMRLQLLEVEGIPLPRTPPLIPDDPPNYNFHYK